MAKQIDIHWEAKLRGPHRLISLFASIQCWLRGIDGLVFTHSDLISILPVENTIREAHIVLLAKNMLEFPFFAQRFSNPYKFVACFVSRRPIEDIPRKDQTSISNQIEIFRQQGVRFETFSLGAFSIWKDLLKTLGAQSVAKKMPKQLLMNDPGIRPSFKKTE